MIDVIGTIDNFTTLPSPVIDETIPAGYRIEQRLQVSLKAASDEKQYTVEFRLSAGGQASDAPSEAVLTQWIESGELVLAFCTGLSARPFVHQDGKQYRTRGKEVQIGAETAALDAFVVFAGVSMAPLTNGPALDAVVRQARVAFKQNQRAYRTQRNTERVAQMEAQMGERVRQMKERQAAEAAAQATPTTEAAASNGRRR